LFGDFNKEVPSTSLFGGKNEKNKTQADQTSLFGKSADK